MLLIEFGRREIGGILRNHCRQHNLGWIFARRTRIPLLSLETEAEYVAPMSPSSGTTGIPRSSSYKRVT